MQLLSSRRNGIHQIGRLGVGRPNHLATELAVDQLPLRQHHLVRGLQAMMGRIGGKLDLTKEGRDVGCVKCRGHLFRIDGAGLFDGVLQHNAGGITGRGVIVGLGVDLRDGGCVLRGELGLRTGTDQ